MRKKVTCMECGGTSFRLINQYKAKQIIPNNPESKITYLEKQVLSCRKCGTEHPFHFQYPKGLKLKEKEESK